MAYLYRHIRLDKNEPFYVGIGSDDSYNRAKKKASRSDYWKNIVSKTDYRIDIVLDDLTWEEACEKEIEFISLYGRADLKKGTLCNLTNGGDGTLGLIVSENAKRLSSLRYKGKSAVWNIGNSYCKGRHHSEETKAKISKINTGKKRSDESRKKMSESHKGVKLPQSQVDKIRQKNTGKKRSEESKKRMSEAQIGNKKFLGKKHTEETKAKMSKSQKGRVVSIEMRKNMSDAHKGQVAWNKGKSGMYSLETIERLRQIALNMSEEQRDKIRQKMLGRKHTKETKDKMSKSQKNRKNKTK